mmetsp:Transcript_22877/g.45970  ORF Transcript_22877/g.45970 Transcript_22877/m.45970 type:complete len:297 (+) Transcript_22877:505-1395(+)
MKRLDLVHVTPVLALRQVLAIGVRGGGGNRLRLHTHGFHAGEHVDQNARSEVDPGVHRVVVRALIAVQGFGFGFGSFGGFGNGGGGGLFVWAKLEFVLGALVVLLDQFQLEASDHHGPDGRKVNAVVAVAGVADDAVAALVLARLHPHAPRHPRVLAPAPPLRSFSAAREPSSLGGGSIACGRTLRVRGARRLGGLLRAREARCALPARAASVHLHAVVPVGPAGDVASLALVATLVDDDSFADEAEAFVHALARARLAREVGERGAQLALAPGGGPLRCLSGMLLLVLRLRLDFS